MINLNILSLLHDQLSTITIIVPSFVLVVRVNSGLAIPFQPNWKFIVISPWCSHKLFRCQILLNLSLMEVKHQKQQLLWHLWHHWKVDHFICWTYGIACSILFSLFWQKVIVYLWSMIIRFQKHLMRNFMCLFGCETNFLIKIFQLIFKNLVFMTDMKIIQILHQWLHMFDCKLSGGW